MQSNCEKCKLRSYSERKPTSFLGRIWRWHIRWCPGWRAYQRKLAESLKARETSCRR